MKVCEKCSCEFPVKVRIDGIVRHLGNRKYCLDCSPFATREEMRLQRAAIEKPCLQCGGAIRLKPRQAMSVFNERKFCSLSCAAKYNNSETPKRKSKAPITLVCEHCGVAFDVPTSSYRRMYCDNCKGASHRCGNRTKASADWQRRDVRSHAISIMRGREKVCGICGYSKFVEICHIKSVAEFPDEATFAEINHPDNLAYLCPNCHWEFDHGMISQEFLLADAA